MRPLFEKIPFPLTFKVYLFNVTNSNEIVGGAKPILSEIGPYVFEWVAHDLRTEPIKDIQSFSEWKIREDIKDDALKDTISYTMKNRFIFRPDLSNGLTGDEIVTLPHLILLGSLLAVKRERAPMLPLVSKAMSVIFNNPKTPFMNVAVKDFLFEGMKFNCDGDDFSVKAVCAAIKSEGQGVHAYNETYLSVSMLGHVSCESVGLIAKAQWDCSYLLINYNKRFQNVTNFIFILKRRIF